MKLRYSNHLKHTYRSRFNRENFTKSAVNTLMLKIRFALKNEYGSIESGLKLIENMLPSEIYFKNLVSLLGFLKVGYTIEDVKNFIKEFSTESDFVSFEMFSKVLTHTNIFRFEKNPSQFPLLVNQGVSTDDQGVLSETLETTLIVPRKGIQNQDFRSTLSYFLQQKFENFIDAFKFATPLQIISYFQLIRLLNHLEIQQPESAITEFLSKHSQNGQITLEKFKKIYYNNDDLCMVPTCIDPIELVSKYCSLHYTKMVKKGKFLFEKIFLALDRKTQLSLKSQISKLFYPSSKQTKETLKNFLKNDLSCKD